MKRNIINIGLALLFLFTIGATTFRAHAHDFEGICDHNSYYCAAISWGGRVESPQQRVSWHCNGIDEDDSCSVPGRLIPEGGDDGIPVAQMSELPMILAQARPIGATEGFAFTSCDITCEDRANRVPVYRGHGDLCTEAYLEAYNNLGYPVWSIGLNATQKGLLLNDCADNINGRLRQQQDEQQREREMQACRDEADRIRSSLSPIPAPYGCDGNRASSDPIESVQRCAPDIQERWYPCRANCDNDCASVSIPCTVYAPASDSNRNAQGFEEDITRCNQMCNDELARITAGMPNCGVGEMRDTGITPDDLAEGGEGDEPWEPDGGWGPEDEQAGGGEEIDNEDLPGHAEGEPEAEEGDYSREDYEREVQERAMENRRNGMPPQEAEDRAIADARSEMNERSVGSRRDEASAASETGQNQAANLRGNAWHVQEQRRDQSREETLQRHPSEIPRSNPDANLTPSIQNAQNADLIGEGQNGRTTGDPVINGHFCADKIFAKTNVPAGPPVEVTGKYCSYQAPSVTTSGALGPGWTLNVESHILYYPGSSNLSYQDPNGDTINFTTDEAPINIGALQNSCSENFGYTARFFAVGKPLVIDAQISVAPEDCHQIVFEFQLLNDNGDKSTFKRSYDFTQPYMGTKVVETRYLWIDPATGERRVNNLRQLHARDLPALDNNIPQYLAQAKDLVRQRTRNAAVLERENDPGPLGMNLLSQSYPEANAFPPDVTEWHDAALNSSYVYSSIDAGFFSGGEGRGRFVSYALPAIVAPVVRWEDASGNRTDIERTTSWEKYHTAQVSGQRFIHNWREIGPLQEREENFRGQTVTTYSYDDQMMRQDDHFISYTLYETLIPKVTEVTLRNGEASMRLDFRWQVEHDITASGIYNRENLFRAPISSVREDIMVLKPRPILNQINGNQTEAKFRYSYVSRLGMCNQRYSPHLIDYTGHMAFFARRDPGDLPAGQQYQLEDCNPNNPVWLKDMWNNFFFAGPLVLTAWVPPHPTTGTATFNAEAVKPEYFFYEQANTETAALRGIKYPLHYIRMTETGFLNGMPTWDTGRREEDRTPYIVNTYNDHNLVETHQLGDTGSIEYTYDDVGDGYRIDVVTRGGMQESFNFLGNLGSGLLQSHTTDTAGSALTTTYEYEPPPNRKPHVQGRLKASRLPDGQRLEYVYRDSGQPNGFYFYQPRIVRRIGTDATQQQTEFHYIIPDESLREKVTRVVTPAPDSETGNETVTTELIYDYQAEAREADLNPCNANQPQGNLVKMIHPDGTYETWKHNRKGQPIFYRNPFGIETTYAYFGTGEACGP